MRERVPYPPLPLLLTALALAAAILSPSVARAEETQNLLHGPHPFLKDNELSVHALIGEGQGDALSGAKLELGYGYKLTGSATAPFWLNLLLSFEHSGCNPATGGTNDCAGVTGDIVETMAGVKWKLATPIPLVPYLQGDAGLVFAFPNGATDSLGVAIRAAGGANYFFFDWLGLGIQVGASVGHIDYDATFHGSHTYAVVDFGGGVEFQF
jgi:hypothetical protein